MAKKQVEYRKEIYKIVEELLGRDLTITEHNRIKDAVVAYVDGKTEHLQTNYDAMVKRLTFLNASWVKLLNKRQTPQEVVAEFDRLFK